MGSPLSPILAQLVMHSMETKILNQKNLPIFFYKRYVDDCLLCIPKNKQHTILNTFNSMNQAIQFTLETEEQKTINFLDLQIKHNNNSITTNWYQKLTSSQRYLNFNSNNPVSHKRGIIFSLIDRCYEFSNGIDFQNNLKKIKSILKENNYPEQFIEITIKKRLNKLKFQKTTNQNLKHQINQEEAKKKFVSIPYIPHTSEKIANILKKYEINVAYKPNKSNNRFFTKTKDTIDKLSQINTVYKINCQQCNSNYIGQSKQQLKKRVYQHEYSVKNKIISTALSEHHIETGHNFDFKNVSILKQENNYHKRLLTEMIEIKKEKNAVNFRTDTHNLSTIYHTLL